MKSCVDTSALACNVKIDTVPFSNIFCRPSGTQSEVTKHETSFIGLLVHNRYCVP